MLHFRGKVSLLSQSQLCHHEDCALLVALIGAQRASRFHMKFFWVFPWRLFCMLVKLISSLENKKQLISFRVYGKIATSAQTDGDR